MKDTIMMLLSVILPVGLILLDKWLSTKEQNRSNARIKELETQLAEKGLEASKATKNATVVSNVLKSVLRHRATQDENKAWADNMKAELDRTMQNHEKAGESDLTLEEALKISREQVEHEESLRNN